MNKLQLIKPWRLRTIRLRLNEEAQEINIPPNAPPAKDVFAVRGFEDNRSAQYNHPPLTGFTSVKPNRNIR